MPPVPSQLLAWPADAPEAVTVVTIAPDFHGVHHGFITNLKKFTAYLASVLCFTTPGDGPPSAPQLVWTHQDREYPLPRVSRAVRPSPDRLGPSAGQEQGGGCRDAPCSPAVTVCWPSGAESLQVLPVFGRGGPRQGEEGWPEGAARAREMVTPAQWAAFGRVSTDALPSGFSSPSPEASQPVLP